MRTFVAGHNGMVGSAICRQMNIKNIMFAPRDSLDLENQSQVENFFKANRPKRVILAAAKVGGIMANKTYPADFIYSNLLIQSNVIDACLKYGVEKMLFLGSSCIYPRLCEQPIKEEALLTGQLEPTNESYAVAKIAGIKMCEAYYKQYGCEFISVMPTNLFGPNDSFDLELSHVLPALVRKFCEAKGDVILWGDGSARREFLHVDDMAKACIHVMNNVPASSIYDQGISHLNIGSGKDITIKELAEKIAQKTGFKGQIIWDTSKPNGMPRKLLDSSRLNRMGWKPEISFDDGLDQTIQYFKKINSIK